MHFDGRISMLNSNFLQRYAGELYSVYGLQVPGLSSPFLQESPLPLTDPRDAVTQRMLNIPYRIIW